MKKIILLALTTSLILNNCGPSADNLETKRIADSIKIVDSMNSTPTLASNLSLNTKTPTDRKFVKSANLKFKVNNVLNATEKIEDIAIKYDGYLVYSNLRNIKEKYKSSRISRDSFLIIQQIVVFNEINLRVPNEKLDSFIRELNSLVVFLDYRVIKLNDVTIHFKSNQKKNERLQKYEQRQIKNFETKSIKQSVKAEEKLLEYQNQADELQLKSTIIEDKVKYCDLNIEIYQKPIIITEKIENIDYVSSSKKNFFVRLLDSIIQGWTILEDLIIFLVKIWGILLLLAIIIFGIRYISKSYKKIK